MLQRGELPETLQFECQPARVQDDRSDFFQLVAGQPVDLPELRHALTVSTEDYDYARGVSDFPLIHGSLGRAPPA